MLENYGVEAARMAIIRELNAVFGVYGISVSHRHLSLVADYMTFEGGYRGMNRMTMRANANPFLKMSFETTTEFLNSSSFCSQTLPALSSGGRLSTALACSTLSSPLVDRESRA
jgi:DNA-directed RNA polymerase I subunit RPA1